MNCKITTTPDFARDLKELAKHYKSLKSDYAEFLKSLRKDPLQGTQLGHNLTLVTIYDKQQRSTITDRELKLLIQKNMLDDK